MRAVLQLVYFLIGLVQLFAVWAGVEHAMGAESFFAKLIAFFITLFVTYIPLVGSLIGVYGAVNVWDWTLSKSLILFFWYVPVLLLFTGYAFFADRK